MMNWKEEFDKKLMSTYDALNVIKDGDRIACGSGNSFPYGALDALWERRHDFKDLTIMSSNGQEPCKIFDICEDNPFSYETFFIGNTERRIRNAGKRVEYTSFHLSQMDVWTENTGKPDVVIAEVSAPDENGYMSFGPSGPCVNRTFLKYAKRCIAQINHHVPFVCGDNVGNAIHVSEADAICIADRPLLEFPNPEIDEVSKTISDLVVAEIPDGATLQLGLGNLSTAIGFGLKCKNDLGIHTELLSEPLIELIENGNVTNTKKGFYDGISVFSFSLGTNKLYNMLDKNPKFFAAPFSYVNDPRIIMQNRSMISVNATMALDLYGQAASDCMNWKQQSATGGQVDFARGAQLSKGGKSFIATTSSFMKNGKRISKIVPALTAGSAITTSRADIQYVATEYGCVNLKPLNMEDRVRAMISLAHPDFREMLRDEAKAHGLIK